MLIIWKFPQKALRAAQNALAGRVFETPFRGTLGQNLFQVWLYHTFTYPIGMGIIPIYPALEQISTIAFDSWRTSGEVLKQNQTVMVGTE